MKNITLLAIIFFPSFLKSQLIDTVSLKGQWGVTQVINARDSTPRSSKYAKIGKYEKFTFENQLTSGKRKKKKHSSVLAFSTSPLEKGIGFRYSLENNIIKLKIHASWGASETEFEVLKATDSTLVLKTSNFTEPKIYYLKKSTYHDRLIQIQPFYIIKHEVGTAKHTFHFDASIGSNNYLIPSFKIKNGNNTVNKSFESELSSILSFPNDFPMNKVLGPLKMIVTIDPKGKVTNVNKENVVNSILDDQIKAFLISSMWTIPNLSKPNATYRLRFLIYYQYLFR